MTDSDSKIVRVDFNKAAAEWHSLGTYHSPRYVSVDNAANGAIVAKFEMLSSD